MNLLDVLLQNCVVFMKMRKQIDLCFCRVVQLVSIHSLVYLFIYFNNVFVRFINKKNEKKKEIISPKIGL